MLPADKEIELTVAGAKRVKLPELDALPEALVTDTKPVTGAV